MAMLAVPIRTAKTSGAILRPRLEGEKQAQHKDYRGEETHHGSGGPETTNADPSSPMGSNGARNNNHQSLLSGVNLAGSRLRTLSCREMTGKNEK